MGWQVVGGSGGDHSCTADLQPHRSSTSTGTEIGSSNSGSNEQLLERTDIPMTLSYESGALAGLREGATRRHLELAHTLHHKLMSISLEDGLGAGPQGSRSRAAVDFATALEKVQKIERRALEMDQPGSQITSQVVILVPQKLGVEEWEKAAAQVLES